MRKKPLIETNPYLKDPAQRQSLLWTAVSSSSIIEGARLGLTLASVASKAIDTVNSPKKPTASSGSRR
ncbi:protein of unknown function [Candidatus Methylomirabilis oxygeniifera]|uniref:Uncharacterized protein n=1 Tax=Methylomirabilis oxygeniifera TaxID=671143 RepID=D5MJ81_METO1|nr:protein of unknown function [Candidatus Methylomirabilis oxyfera]